MQNLKIEDIEKAWSKLMSNGTALIKDAELLYQANRFPRAYSLAHLACEEFAKLQMLTRAAGAIFKGDPFDWRSFEKGFRNHKLKLLRHSILEALVSQRDVPRSEFEQFLRELCATVNDLNEVKNKSIYVDFSNGRFSAPDDIISSEMAKGIIDTARRCEALYTRFELTDLEGIDWNYVVSEDPTEEESA